MPFSDGLKPDIKSSRFPSRMTIGQLVECIAGKAACGMGASDSTAFVNKGSKHELFGSLLTSVGYNSTGIKFCIMVKLVNKCKLRFYRTNILYEAKAYG